MLLVADIGGTNARLALYDGVDQVARHTEPSSAHASLWPIVADFLARESAHPKAACAGVAGPVRGQKSDLTNLGWHLDGADLSRRLGAPFRLINDFHAQALAIPTLGPEGSRVLIEGEDAPADAPIAVLGAGTGLGEAILVPKETGGWIAVPGEGSHGRFPPRDARTTALLDHLRERFGHVSVERVVSGPGISNVYRFLSGELKTPAEIVAAGLGGAPMAYEALEIFIDAYAEEAATMALKCLAGEVYLTGGVTPRVVPPMLPRFQAAFVDKGRYRGLMETVRVSLVTHPDPGLLGALVMARSLEEEQQQ